MNTNSASTSGSGSLPSDTFANPRGDMKAITTRSGVSYDGPQVHLRLSSLLGGGNTNPRARFHKVHDGLFHDMIEETMEVFMDDFSVFGDSFSSCLSHLDKMLKRFIQDFSKISRPMTHLLEKETPFVFSKECVEAFNALKKKLTEAPILVAPDWDLPFKIICDASDFTIGAVLGQRLSRTFEASRARGFCPSFTQASHPQLHFRNPISKSYRLTSVELPILSLLGVKKTGHLSRSRLGCAEKEVATWNDLAFKIIILG
ncbi:reverse transcriptase domain-containing protein [Tanacetum coccineum]